MIYLFQMVILHSYVSLPESNTRFRPFRDNPTSTQTHYFGVQTMAFLSSSVGSGGGLDCPSESPNVPFKQVWDSWFKHVQKIHPKEHWFNDATSQIGTRRRESKVISFELSLKIGSIIFPIDRCQFCGILIISNYNINHR